VAAGLRRLTVATAAILLAVNAGRWEAIGRRAVDLATSRADLLPLSASATMRRLERRLRAWAHAEPAPPAEAPAAPPVEGPAAAVLEPGGSA
jgi:hypothetical protein